MIELQVRSCGLDVVASLVEGLRDGDLNLLPPAQGVEHDLRSKRFCKSQALRKGIDISVTSSFWNRCATTQSSVVAQKLMFRCKSRTVFKKSWKCTKFSKILSSERCKGMSIDVNRVDLEKCWKISVWLQKSGLIQTKTSHLKIAVTVVRKTLHLYLQKCLYKSLTSRS